MLKNNSFVNKLKFNLTQFNTKFKRKNDNEYLYTMCNATKNIQNEPHI